ncbi:ent-kaurenoic acid oxidase 2-like [Magnolia sinica]|uniref:ent-kaurenoic acid oxidase 2-like n=1 Tax=Magnolia sinica TaxID=86752 RepID=UPI00265A3505|nr:ent-kaurenoic acid oxidase 2-like [Magnolia sinica]
MEVVTFATSTALVLLSFLVLYVRWINDRWHLRGLETGTNGSKVPPGSMGWPLIGEFLDFLWCFKFLRKPDHFIAKRKARYGDIGIYRTHLFGYPTIITCTPQLNKQVLGSMTEEGSFSTGWPSSQLIGNSAVAIVDGVAHKRIRRHLMEAFNSPKALKALLITAQPIFISTFEEWASKGKIIAFEEIKTMTFYSICDMLISFKSKDLLDTMERLYRGLMAGIRSMTINVPGTAYHWALKCRKKLTGILLDEVRKRKEMGTQKQDFMQMMMDSTDENGENMSEMEVVENIVSLILGGYESTSNVMTWALYYLAKYPSVLNKLKEEIRGITNQKSKDELLTLEDIKEMKYTSKVADELIRLSNVSPFIFRRVVKDNVVLNGYKIPKNWKVIVWIRSIHVDPDYYDDPLTFNPDRWSDLKPKVGTYTVFGHGPRYCPGNNFARLQVIMFLYHVCLKYRWELLNPEAGVKFQPHPKPVDGAEMYFSHAK